MDGVIRNHLCDHEINFINKRQKKIQEALKRHEIPYAENNVPRVAVLGSGGGQRAHTGFLGVMQQLGNEDLLDLVLYVAGVSGSTWCMSSLYEDPNWSQHADVAASKALLSMSKAEGASFSECVGWLRGRHKEGDLSLSDVWGVLTCRIKGVPLETRPLMRDQDEDGASPYPLYSAIEKHSFHENKLDELWFEFSPHESGFLEPGVYVETSLLKKDFEGGKVKPAQRNRKPIDMVQLQGIGGCAMGDFDTIKQYIKDSVWDWIHSVLPGVGGLKRSLNEPSGLCGMQGESFSPNGELDILCMLADLMKNGADTKYRKLDSLKCQFGDQHGEFSPTLQGVTNESWNKMTDHEKKKILERICDELMASIEKWSPDNDATGDFMEFMEADDEPRPLKAGLRSFQSHRSNTRDAWWIAKNILPNVKEWEFGKMANFLCNFPEPKVSEEMCQKNEIHLIDAGLYLNSPYASALREARDVDVIISFDFSQDTPFVTVEKASDYADANERPFPKIDVKDYDNDRPKSFYVFEEEGKPTVIHIPLFNMDNCKDESTIKNEWNEYGTFQRTYRDQEKINHLADLAAKNVKMNKDAILEIIRKAAERRMAKC